MERNPNKRFRSYMLFLIAAVLLIVALLRVYDMVRDHRRNDVAVERP